MTTHTVAIADDAALPACFALLPMLAMPDTLVLTVRDADGTLAGAGGVLWRSWGSPPAFPTWIHVLPDRRRQGLGRALLAALVHHVRGETAALIGAAPLARDSEGGLFAATQGATAERQHLYFEMHTPAFHSEMTRLVARLEKSGRVPAEACVESLNPDNAPGVIALVANHFAVAPPQAEAMLARAMVEDPATAPIDRERTCVVRIGNAVAGVLVARRKPVARGTDIMFRVVAAEWRGGWINALLMERFLARTAASGDGDYVTFDCIDTNTDTRSLAARSGAQTLRVDAVWRYALTNGAS